MVYSNLQVCVQVEAEKVIVSSRSLQQLPIVVGEGQYHSAVVCASQCVAPISHATHDFE